MSRKLRWKRQGIYDLLSIDDSRARGIVGWGSFMHPTILLQQRLCGLRVSSSTVYLIGENDERSAMWEIGKRWWRERDTGNAATSKGLKLVEGWTREGRDRDGKGAGCRAREERRVTRVRIFSPRLSAVAAGGTVAGGDKAPQCGAVDTTPTPAKSQHPCFRATLFPIPLHRSSLFLLPSFLPSFHPSLPTFALLFPPQLSAQPSQPFLVSLSPRSPLSVVTLTPVREGVPGGCARCD